MGTTTEPIVFNMSWVGQRPNRMLRSATAAEWNTGRAVFVGAALGQNNNTTGYPAGYANVVGVTGVTQDDVKGRDTGYGAYVDVAAPVEGVPTVRYDASTGQREYHVTGGTTPSISAAQVSGLAALVWSHYPELTNAGVVHQVLSTADDIRAANAGRVWSGQIGSGRINAYRALTEWSGPLLVQAGATLTWSGTITITDHVRVPAGITLALEAGTEVRFQARNVNRLQLVVSGTLDASASDITFRSTNDSPTSAEWDGILVPTGGRANLSGARLQDGTRCVSNSGGTVTLTNALGELTTVFSNCGPGVPRALEAVPGDGQVTLTWQAPLSDGGSPITRYEHRRSSGGWTSVSGGAAARRQLVTGLTNGTAYTFEVRAVNRVGAGDSGRVTETPLPLSLPPPPPPSLPRPTGLVAQAVGSGQVKLTWNNPGIAVGQWLYGVKKGTGSFIWKSVPDSDATTTTYTVANLTNGVEYRFKVRIKNDEVVSRPSEVAVATPMAVCRVELSGLSAVSFAEHGSGAVATYTATATDCGALAWSLGGTDARAFRLDGSGLTRTLHFNSPPNFEVKQTYAVEVVVAEGTGAEAVSDRVSVTVSVTNVEEAGTITLSSTQPRVGEAITATLSDPDGAVTNLRWSWLYFRADTSTEEEAVSGTNGSLSATFRPSSVLVGIRLQARALLPKYAQLRGQEHLSGGRHGQRRDAGGRALGDRDHHQCQRAAAIAGRSHRTRCGDEWP